MWREEANDQKTKQNQTITYRVNNNIKIAAKI